MSERGTLSSTSKAFFLYISLCIFRIVNALSIQTQFDPDEYWQNLEPAYCEAFRPERQCAYTWEWSRRAASDDEQPWWVQSMEGPLRSYLSILPTYLFYMWVKWWQWDSSTVIARGPLVVHAVLVAAPTDWATWEIGKWMVAKNKDTSKKWMLPACCLLCSITSWFNGYALVRTYSNSLEAMLLSVGIALVSPELFGDTTGRHYGVRAAVAFILGGISVAIRFTSLAAWIPVGLLLALERPTMTKRVRFLVVPCALFGLVGVGISLIVDRLFYGFWTIPFLGSLHFNVIQGLGSLYGTHPAHRYVSAGIPAITGILFPLLLYDLWTMSQKSSQQQQKVWILIASYTLLHSCSAHKEFRFLLPILPLFCVRAGHVLSNSTIRLSTTSRRRWILFLLVIPNLVVVIYLGTFHQGAPIQINRRIRKVVSQARAGSSYSVHYLMACHSTPLYSHLHVPSIQMDAWALDCSPKCRISGSCESDRFSLDPMQFVQDAYQLEEKEDKECRPLPDFVAVFASDADKLEQVLTTTMGLVEMDRFAHGIVGVKVGAYRFGQERDVYRHVDFGMFEFVLDDMVLFAKPEFQYVTTV